MALVRDVASRMVLRFQRRELVMIIGYCALQVLVAVCSAALLHCWNCPLQSATASRSPSCCSPAAGCFPSWCSWSHESCCL